MWKLKHWIVTVCLLASCAQPEKRPQSAQEVLDRALQAYASLQSYEDSVLLEQYSLVPGVEDVSTTDAYTFSFQRPGQFRLDSFEGSTLVSDGQSVLAHMMHYARYSEQELSRPVAWDSFAGFVGRYVPMLHPVAAILIAGQESGSFPLLQSAAAFREGQLEGVAADIVEATLDYSLMGYKQPVPAQLWFSQETGLLLALEADLAAATEALVGQPVTANTQKLTFSDIRTDHSLDPEEFVFKPRPVDRQVANLLEIEDDGSPNYLQGRPAPEIESTDLQGNPVSFQDFRGKVVLLEFWATWCGACSRSMKYIQQIADDFAEQDDLVVLGVNMDDPGSDDRIRQYLEKKEIDIRHIRDSGSRISSAFRVIGTPTVAVIDRAGVVQMVRSGQGDWMVEEYGGLLSRLLEGQAPD